MIKLKDILLEKKELNPKQIQAIGVLTQRNNHNVARALVAKDLLKDKQLYTAYMRIDDLTDFFIQSHWNGPYGWVRIYQMIDNDD